MTFEENGLRKVIIELIKPSALDALRCADGEVENGDWLFAQESAAGSDEGEGGFAPSRLELDIDSLYELSSGAVALCVHLIEGATGHRHLAMQTEGGRLRFIDLDNPSADMRDLTYEGIPAVEQAVGVGDFIVFLTASGLLYARWDHSRGRYQWLGAASEAPEADFLVQYSAMPPYSLSGSEYPQFTVGVEMEEDAGAAALSWLSGQNPGGCSEKVKQTVRKEIGTAFQSFLTTVRATGLHYGCMSAAMVRTLADGRPWRSGQPTTIRPEGEPSMSVVSAAYAAGCLRVTLQLQRRPYSVVPDGDGGTLESGWDEMIAGCQVMEGEEEYDFIPTAISDATWLPGRGRGFMVSRKEISGATMAAGGAGGDMQPYGSPDFIHSSGQRLLAVYARGDGRDCNVLLCSDPHYPFVCGGVSHIHGGRMMAVEQSLRSHSSSAAGEFPLYAFCSDGIRALLPAGKGYGEVQLISRDVLMDRLALTPTPRGVCFLTEQGVMKIEGTSVASISKGWPSPPGFGRNSRIAFLYESDRLTVYDIGAPQAAVYDFRTAKWNEAMWTDTPPSGHHYGWPRCWFRAGNRFGEVQMIMAGASGRVVLPETMRQFATRPIKFGKPFTGKKLLYVEGCWPDGSWHKISVYGSNRLDKWHFLGSNESGKMRLRGSAWRFYKVESYVLKENSPGNNEKSEFIKPLIYCIIKDE